MGFLNIIITYLTALDYAKENGNDDIAELISGYPYSLIKLHSDKSIQLKNKIGQLIDENEQFKDENKKLENENNRLKEMASKYESIKTKKKESTVNEFKTLTEEEFENLIRDKEISTDIGAKIIKVFMKEAYALKEMNIERPKAKDMQHFIHEYEIMILLDHVNILKALSIFLSATKPCILFESCYISLLNGIKNRVFSNKQLILIIYQIAEGMRYVHSKKIIHSNLNPENILITTDGTVKIAGFGLSRLKTDDNTDASIYEEIPYSFYKAPEIIKGDALYDEKVDVFAFGFLVFFILNQGNYPKITKSVLSLNLFEFRSSSSSL
ncbi:LIM domain kinase 1 [Tritrichomonas musculus]|uniref:LIM domain kinase 1 n=1 Tax=Tritrichomonas musculus TaxID=1915356 RepID=A0ABR2HNF5_9EUKA